MALTNAERQQRWRERHKAEYDRAEVEALRERLQAALLKLELRNQDVARLDVRNTYLEAELKRVEQHHTIALKEIITLKRRR
jgi:hypothetical protein